jgi:LmbE family N-acetylglucosaminyl deacetylase
LRHNFAILFLPDNILFLRKACGLWYTKILTYSRKRDKFSGFTSVPDKNDIICIILINENIFNMNKQKTLMFVGAHPDDETFGLGAILAQYAASGVKVYYLCATRGEAGTVEPTFLKGYQSIGDLRWDEMTKAAQVLGLTGFFHLGYRDSGMTGSPDNLNPDAMINAPIGEAAGRILKFLREIKPDVVITHDPSGGYGHPDHVATHNATVRAFNLSSDPEQHPEAGPAFQPRKLYCTIRSHRFMKLVVRSMPLFRQDPHHFGRNKDIDFVKMLENDYPIHASVRIRKGFLKIKDEAAACHASQISGRPSGMGFMRLMNTIFGISNILVGNHDYFMRLYPEVKNKRLETDLFQGI